MEQPRVALLRSEYTRQAHRALSNNSTDWIDVTLRSWREFLLDNTRNISFSEITDADVEAGDLDDYDTLILPSVRAMSDQEIENIKAFMENGGSVFATWTPGIYKPDGSWRGWGFIEEAFGVDFVDFVERGTGNYRVYQDTFPGQTPPGLYHPDYYFSESNGIGDAQTTSSDRTFSSSDFPPLSGYRRTGSLTDTPPKSDYATADTLTLRIRDIDGQLRRQKAVSVSYYTWTGGETESQIPYPYTNTGILRFTLRGNTPLTANIPSGYRVKVQVYNPGVRMRVMEPRTIPVGFWYDFATEDRVITEALTTTTGAVYGTYGQGRFVYVGFQRDAMGVGLDDREDFVVLGRFYANIINYLRRRPIIWVHDWPSDYAGAAVLTGIGETEIDNFAGVADIFAQDNIPGTYFVRPDQAPEHRALLQRLYDAGDVGVQDDLLHNTDGSENFQRERLANLRLMLESIVDGPVTGYRSTKRGQFSPNTLNGLTEAEYLYFLPDSIGRRTVPKIMGFPYETLTRIGVTTDSDLAVFDQTPRETNDIRNLFFQENIDRVRYEGALYHLIYSSDMLARPENRDILRNIVRTLREQNFWVQSGDELTHWWRLRKGLDVDIRQRGPHRLVMSVSNNNGNTAEEMSVTIALGRAVEGVRIQPELIGIPTPEPILQANNTELLLRIEQLNPQQNRIFHIDLFDEETNRMFSRN